MRGGHEAMPSLQDCDLTISRVYGSDNGDRVRITAKAGLKKLAVIDVTLLDFAKAVMGELVPAKATDFK